MTAARSRPTAGVMRRAVAAVPLVKLCGPASGVHVPPRRIWWSGRPAVDFSDLGQVAVFYEAVLDAGTAEDYAEWLNAGHLTELWPSLGMRDDLQAMMEALNPQLVDVGVPDAAVAA